MLADDTNLFLTNKCISYLLETANLQLKRTNEWFINSSLNKEKKSNHFFINQTKGKIFRSFYQ